MSVGTVTVILPQYSLLSQRLNECSSKCCSLTHGIRTILSREKKLCFNGYFMFTELLLIDILFILNDNRVLNISLSFTELIVILFNYVCILSTELLGFYF